jgi:hypothetical protein
VGSADTGEADQHLASALASYDDSAAARASVLAALVGARVFAAITATSTAEHVEEGTGLRAESSAEMAVVLLQGQEGARALPVFSDLASMKRWRLDVRPVPMTGAAACRAALEQGASTVLLDTRLDITELADLARGWVPVAGTGLATRTGPTELREPDVVPPGLTDALAAAVRDEPLRSARLLQGPEGLVLGVAPKQALAPEDLAALAHRVVARAHAALPADGIDLTVVPPRGPGRELVRRRRFLRLP